MPTKVIAWDETTTNFARTSRIDLALKRDGDGNIIGRYAILHFDDILPQQKLNYDDMAAPQQAMFRNLWRKFGEDGLTKAAEADPDLDVTDDETEDEFD